MKSSQSTDYFDDDNEFKAALMSLNVDEPAPKSEPPATVLSKKRKHEEVDQEGDVNLDVLATMRQRDDKQDIYGASSFGDYGEYMARKRAKLQIQNARMDKKSTIFEGIEIYINGRVEPSLQELREMIVEHGGIFHAYLTKKTLVTHIIAMNLTPAKVKEFARMKVVRPAWIVESVKTGFLLPWNDFKLVIDARVDTAQGRRTGQTLLRPIEQTQTGDPEKQTNGGTTPIKDPIYMTDPVTMEQAARIPSYALNKSNSAAQRLMAQPGWREANTATSGTKFIDSYYENSRLHHLSMWKAELKDLVGKARERNDNGEDVSSISSETPETTRQMGHGVSMKGAELLKTWEGPSPSKKGKETRDPIVQRVYMHCDFDSFFVSASLLAHPEHRGKPAVVCHSQGAGEGAASTSEVASSSYEARDSGIHNGMSLGQARQLCPEVVTLPYEFEMYKRLSLEFYTVLLSFTDELQAVSVDEALLDVSHAVANLKIQSLSQDPLATTTDFAKVLAEQIRARLLDVTQCQVSIGVGENLLLARIASRKAKPAGSYHLLAPDAQQFLAPLPLDMIWGVGHMTKKKAEEKLQITTIGDILPKAKTSLVKVFGPAMGEKLYKAARGLDDSKLQLDQKRKSVSAEINFGIRFEANDQAAVFIRKLGDEVASRLQAIEMKGRLLTLKVMKRHPEAPIEAAKFMGHGICEQFSKSAPLVQSSDDEGATNDGNVIGEVAWQLLDSLGFDPRELRGLGLQVTKLEGKEGPTTESETKLESGQKTLNFPTSPGKVVKSPKSASGVNDIHFASFEMPTAENLDQAFLEELPADIREEILGQLRGSAEAGPSSVQGQQPDPDIILIEDDIVEIPAPFKTEPKTPNIPPQVGDGPSTKSPNVGHITRQLRPKTKTIISPTKIALFTKQRKVWDTSKEELEELGIDPSVFFSIPEDIQREQLAHGRENARKDKKLLIGISGRADSPGALKAGGFGFGPGRGRFTRSPSAGPSFGGSDSKLEAKFPETVSLSVASRTGQAEDATTKGKGRADPPLNLVNVADIQAHLKRWVVTCHKTHLPPADTDLQALRTWLTKCLKMEGTGTGIEKAIVVMKWWRELLRGCWGEGQSPKQTDAEDANMNEVERVRDAWWKAFWESKEAMDGIVQAMMGGKLSLK